MSPQEQQHDVDVERYIQFRALVSGPAGGSQEARVVMACLAEEARSRGRDPGTIRMALFGGVTGAAKVPLEAGDEEIAIAYMHLLTWAARMLSNQLSKVYGIQLLYWFAWHRTPVKIDGDSLVWTLAAILGCAHEAGEHPAALAEQVLAGSAESSLHKAIDTLLRGATDPAAVMAAAVKLAEAATADDRQGT